MSKMPAKKKSCFKITSVTQAQEAANSINDDTESIDDLDETRAEEDESSEIFDVSRTDVCVCDHSSSEETLNHVREHQEGTSQVNGGLCYKIIGNGGRNTPLNGRGTPISCNSRFRVIKLDHSTGEPFRRGRWTCTEFYEKDSDSNRTVDSIKPTLSNDHSIDRDSGLGATSNCVAVSSAFSIQAVENVVNGYSKGYPTHLLSPEPLQQGYSLAPQIGSVASAFQPTEYATTASQQAQVNGPVASQTFIPNSLNVVHQGAMLHKSPVMPPATQPQQLAYLNTGMSSGYPDYRPQHFVSNNHSFPATSLALVPPSSRASSPLITPTGPGGPGLLPQGAEASLAPGPNLQTVSASAVTPSTQTQVIGATGISAASPVTINSHNVPVHTVTSGQTLAKARLVSSNFNSLSEDTRTKSDALPQPVSSVVPVKDVKPLITEGLGLPSPTVSFFGISISVDGDDDSASGASVVAIDNKIEQAMDLVKSHLMFAVREEVEVLKEQIKELYERNSVLERENAVLKSLANTEQLSKLSTQLNQVNSAPLPPLQQQHSVSTTTNTALVHYEAAKSIPHQPNSTSA